jgi:hypothetical protein
MSHRPGSTTLFVVLVIAAAAIGVLGATRGAPAWAAPASAPHLQAAACTWKAAGNAPKAVFYAASAMDTANHHLYVYGGLDESLETQNTVQRIDLSGSIDAPSHSTLTGVPALKRYAAAGAFRAHGDDSAVLFFGGAGDVLSGAGTDTVQAYHVKTGQWSSMTSAGVFEDRLFAAAAYDPIHDVVWVTGGVDRCSLSSATAGNCPARTFPTKYLAFDPAGGAATWRQLSGSGPNQVYGHQVVFDPTGKRLLLVGGTRDGRIGSSDVWQLDLSGADPAAATWSTLSTGGANLPRVALHVADLDIARNRLVLYGGATSNLGTGNENTLTTTYALDLASSPPTWSDLGVGIQARVGSSMGYAANHFAMVLSGGRRAYRDQPPQDVRRDTQVLSCADQPPTIPPPSTPGTPGTPVPSPTTPGTPSTPVTPTTPPASPTSPTQPPTNIPPPFTPVPTSPTQPPTSAQVCRFVQQFNRVPPAAIASAMANPASISGWGRPCNIGVPTSGANPLRTYLSLHNINKPYHPLFNSLVFRCGCP